MTFAKRDRYFGLANLPTPVMINKPMKAGTAVEANHARKLSPNPSISISSTSSGVGPPDSSRGDHDACGEQGEIPDYEQVIEGSPWQQVQHQRALCPGTD
jgi:hypothetical protein